MPAFAMPSVHARGEKFDSTHRMQEKNNSTHRIRLDDRPTWAASGKALRDLFVVSERSTQRLHLLCEVDVVHRHEHVARQETFASHLNQHLDLIHGYGFLFVLCLKQLETSSFASFWQTCRQVSS